MNAQALGEQLCALVRAQDFADLRDHHHGGQAIAHFPTIDFALIAFPSQAAPVAANVLFSRQYPDGLVADIAPAYGAVQNIRYLRDFANAEGESPAWFRAADWNRMRFEALSGNAGERFLAPYPASLIKMMVAVGIARLVDQQRLTWDARIAYAQDTRSLAIWCEAMITESCNTATNALVKVLHEAGAILRSLGPNGQEIHNEVEAHLHAFGLTSLKFGATKADGGWRNADGAGVGHLCMTAWDSARLFWLLDEQAPSAPWCAAAGEFLSAASRACLRRMLERQGLHIVLSSGVLSGLEGHVAGMPAQVPEHWIGEDGSCTITPEHPFPPDVRVANATAEVVFAHKTGGTDNYCSDAGIVQGIRDHRRHYIVAILTNIGKRYADRPHSVASWKLAALGRDIDLLMRDWLEADRL